MQVQAMKGRSPERNPGSGGLLSSVWRNITPGFKDERHREQVASILVTSAWLNCLAWTLTALFEPVPIKIILALVNLAVCFLFVRRIRKGHLNGARLGLPLLASVSINTVMAFYAGIHDITNIAQVLPIVLAEAVLGWSGALIVILTSIAGYITLFTFEYTGFFPPQNPAMVPRDVVQGTLMILAGAAMVRFFHTARVDDLERRIKAESRYRLLADNIVDVVWVCDDKIQLTYVSPSCVSLLGYTAEEMLASEPRPVLIHPDDSERTRGRFRELLDGGAGDGGECAAETLEYRLVCKDGAVRWIESTLRRVRTPDSDAYVLVGVSRDITERVELASKNQDFLVKALKSQHMESIGMLASGVAHDFNNILTAVKGGAEELAEDLSGPQQHVAEEILRAGEQAAELCRQLLAYTGKGNFDIRPVDLVELTRDAAAIAKARASGRVSLEIGAGANDLFVEADVRQLRQVVLNLLVNAVDAVPRGSGVIRVNLKRSVVLDPGSLEGAFFPAEELMPPGVYVVLTVQDNGVGMEAQQIAEIFKPFYTTKATGSGLGLSATMSFLKQHGGWMGVSSTVNVGTRMEVYLPASRSAETAPSGTEPEPKAAVKIVSELRASAILVVDDESAVRRLVTRSAESLGYAVCEAEDGLEGWSAYGRDRDRFGAAFIDVNMPGMSGIELCAAIRGSGGAMPLIVMSGMDDPEQTEALLALGNVTFLKKPFGINQLRELFGAVTSKMT